MELLLSDREKQPIETPLARILVRKASVPPLQSSTKCSMYLGRGRISQSVRVAIPRSLQVICLVSLAMNAVSVLAVTNSIGDGSSDSAMRMRRAPSTPEKSAVSSAGASATYSACTGS